MIMQSFFYYIPFYILIGAVGMAVANRKVDDTISKQRWLKYLSYLLIAGLVATSIFLNFFPWVAVAIATAGTAELILVNLRKNFSLVSILTYAIIATGFICFAFEVSKEAQLFIYFQVLIFDAFGQITGQLFGKHKLIPKISPAKTVEGFIGAMLFCIISALISKGWVNLSFQHALLWGIFSGLSCFTGDLLASWLKRQKNIKNYSNWLPGQGGILDRFDSLIFTGAVGFVVINTYQNFI
jgi:phosphatidate cytidylyltransferase